MKIGAKSIWNNASWTLQARNLIEGINIIPEKAKVALFIRHSHRKHSTDTNELEILGLTELGIEIAKLFGNLLPKHRFLRIYHSHSPRCIQTAKQINKGFCEIGGSSELMGATSALNETKSKKNFITDYSIKYGGIDFIKHWRNNTFNIQDIMLFSNYCLNVYKLIEKGIDETPKGGIEIHVSHDLFIYALRYGWFNNMEENIWISFLGGFAIIFDNGFSSLLDIGKSLSKPIFYTNNKNLPIFNIKNIN